MNNKTLTFEDFEKIHDSLIFVEKIIHEYHADLVQSKNYKDLAILASLQIKLDEIENIIIDECRLRGATD